MPSLAFSLVQLLAAAIVCALMVVAHRKLTDAGRALAWAACTVAYVAFQLFAYWHVHAGQPIPWVFLLESAFAPTLAYGVVWWTTKLKASQPLQTFVAALACWLVSYPIGVAVFAT